MFTTYAAKSSDRAGFVKFWAGEYDDPKEPLYTNNIGQTFTALRVRQLFEWKNGSTLSAAKLRSVKQNFVARIPNVRNLPAHTDARSFLKMFPKGGAIWRIFWLHCWQPNKFPIYDQHVHRAMAFIEEQRLEELPGQKDPYKVEQYLERYILFHRQFQGMDQREVDKALWCYGRFIKTYRRFPTS